METRLSETAQQHPKAKEIESILRSCVHCGFCNATCPTYQLLGDENEGPRGRIYLIKKFLEGQPITEKTVAHLDHCLHCASCETTCPSGVKYTRLLDISRHMIEESYQRPIKERKQRKILANTLSSPLKFSTLLSAGRLTKTFLPRSLTEKIPKKRTALNWPTTKHQRKMLILDGCAQSSISPDINSDTAHVLDKMEISLYRIKKVSCCGAVKLHLSEEEAAIQQMRNNIDLWWRFITDGVEAIITTASGCGITLKEYAYHLKDDTRYARKAVLISKLSKDIAEVINNETIPISSQPLKLAWHPPCTLQHAQGITGVVEGILEKAGHQLVPVANSHLCCGSAGTYSILQPDIANQLRENKLEALTADSPDMIVTANIGCQTHLEQKSDIPINHWIKTLL
ncbi:MAG TPA: glycolate oxidase subunit GlcF [Thiotrichaceae bacterium]|nr:glycolate oxidase subunit GlcF [Thiotrichaceae bacterium]